MITGFNTDVEYEGRVYHVQTEDKGRDNPIVESLVYTGGEIVTSRRSRYEELAKSDAYSEKEVLNRMEAQHQALVREILGGRFDPDGPKPFGYNIITNRSLDEVVLEFLGKEVGLERIELCLDAEEVLTEGSEALLAFRVMAGGSERPVTGAKVTVKLISTSEKPRVLFGGVTDAHGRVQATVELPELPGANGAILCQAEAAGRNAEMKQLIRKRPPPDAAG